MAAAAAALFPPTAGRDGAEAAVAKATTGRERRGGASLRPARKVVADEDQTSALGQNPAGAGMGTGRAGAGLGGGCEGGDDHRPPWIAPFYLQTSVSQPRGAPRHPRTANPSPPPAPPINYLISHLITKRPLSGCLPRGAALGEAGQRRGAPAPRTAAGRRRSCRRNGCCRRIWVLVGFFLKEKRVLVPSRASSITSTVLV